MRPSTSTASFEERGEHFRALAASWRRAERRRARARRDADRRKARRSPSKPAEAETRQQPLEHRLLLTATFCLLAGGAVMVYSASSARTLLEGQGDGTAYLVKYLVYGAVGLVVMHVLVARTASSAVARLTPCSCSARVRAALLVLMPGFGVEINGARRWLGAGPLQFQPVGGHEARARAARGGGDRGAAEDHAAPARASPARLVVAGAAAVR